MFQKSLYSLLIGLCCSATLIAAPLTPQPPVVITNDGNVYGPVSVAGTSAGFMSAWQDSNSYNVLTSFSSNLGTSWNTPVQVDTDASYYVNVVGRGSTFVVTYTHLNPGYSNGTLHSSTTSNQGMSWSSPVLISPAPNTMPGGNVEAYTSLCVTNAGFMAAWPSDDPVGYTRAWSAFSSDGTSWNPAQLVSVDPMQVQYGTVSVAGNSAGFLVAWQDNSLNAYVSFSMNNGTTWNTPTIAATNLFHYINPTVFGTDAGFMMAWIDASSNLYSSFSADNGSSWSTPTLIANNLATDNYISINLSGTDAGFVVDWIDQSANLNASFTSDLGAQWSTPVVVASMVANLNYKSFPGVSATGGNCIFTWWSSSNDAFSSYSTFPGGAPTGKKANSPFIKQITPCKPGMGLFN